MMCFNVASGGHKMKSKLHNPFLLFVLICIFVSLACSTAQPTPTNTPQSAATATETAIPTNTPRPSPTLRPTQTPNFAVTQRVEELNAEAQAFYDKGYLAKTDGKFTELDDFSYDWAQLGWYNWLPLKDSASDFFLSAHFKWDSAFKNSDISGCGFIFDLQPNKDHYAVFLDRMKVFFLITDHALGFSKPVSPTRGTGRVKFDYPAQADFTLIVKGAYAYVLVDNEVVGEYTLAQSRSLNGGLGLTVLSGTNKDYGTHCEMTNLHLWVPQD
jgi:hypothetical protein